METEVLARERSDAAAAPETPPALPSLSREAWRIVRLFEKTARREEAFYLRFECLCERDRRVLKDCWALGDDWALYRRLCRFCGVGMRVTRADRRERAYWQQDARQGRFPFAEDGV